MCECASEIVKYAKETLNMKRIFAYVICEHTKSISLLLRLGFEKLATLPNDTENKGKYVDRYKFELDFAK
ncbi:MAG: hypothetical protein ABT01_00495 [Clostridium sp. SCN 57-10]|nr:MAG: hypothetical protein ABT01_00495 [Clostridium sp. SCN 57-10]